MLRSLLVALLVAVSGGVVHAGEWIFVSGGCALMRWELRKRSVHDRNWDNFIESAEARMEQVRASLKPGDTMTWLVYRPSYVARYREFNASELAEFPGSAVENIAARARNRGVQLEWFDSKEAFIAALNRRAPGSIVGLELFVHSNKVNMMFDYSNQIDGCSVEFLHTRDLPRIRRNVFAHRAFVQSWGCHSGEYYSRKWREIFGVPMRGAMGKTDYSLHGVPVLSGGRWVQ
jgi:hypothetical protein